MSAPAGYGKTTQVRALLDGREESTAWYSFDDGDNDPGRFVDLDEEIDGRFGYSLHCLAAELRWRAIREFE